MFSDKLFKMNCTITDHNPFQNFMCSIDELYIYIHRDTINKDIFSSFASDSLTTTIIMVFFITLFKISLIFICFFIKWLLWDILIIIFKLFKYKCSILWKECCFNINYFKKVFKKVYTYNFYSYDKDVYGPVWIILIPFLYISFIICNLIFCYFEKYLNNNSQDDQKDNNIKNIFLICIFYLHLFIEVYISLFYCVKDLFKHIKYTTYIFLAGCFISMLVFLSSFLFIEEEKKDLFCLCQRSGRMVYVIFFICAYIKSFNAVKKYNMNSKKNFIY